MTGKIANSGTQKVKAANQSKPTAKGKVKTGGDLRQGGK